MRDPFKLHTTQKKYWVSIMSTIVVLGAALGYVGTRHAMSMPKLSLSTQTADQRFTGIEHNITDLDVRLTIVENKDGKQAVATNKGK